MQILDILVLLGYFVLLVVIGARASRGVKSNEDALAGGRSFGIITAAVGRTANMAGGPATVGNTTYGFEQGIGGSWFAISNIISMWIAAPLAPRMYRVMQRGNLITIGDFIGYRFGRFPKVFAGITNFLAYTGFVAANIIATGTVIHIILGWNMAATMIGTAIIVILYTMAGGLKSVFQTNILQVGIMILGFFAILMPISVNAVGGWSELMQAVPDSYLKLGSMGAATIIGTILIPTALTGFTTQAGYVSIASSKNISVSWKSTLVSGIFYAFIALPVILVGMAAFVLFPNANPQQVLAFTIVELLPNGLVGVLLAAVISATMSTAASCMLNAVTCFSQDVLGAFKKETASEEQSLKRTRVLIVAIGAIALVFAVLLPDVIQLLLIGYSLAAGGLLVPVFATMFWKRATSKGIIASMLSGGISYLVLTRLVTWPPLFLSIPLSLVVLVVVSLMDRAQDPKEYAAYFEDVWSKYHPV